ncbi:MAG: VOC family protein [Kofleriaceae bacterium]
MNKLTPNLVVDRIEDVLPFYLSVGFTKTMDVPHEGSLGFAILHHGSVELMLQSRPSVAADVPPLAAGGYRSMLYIEVDALAPIRTALGATPLVVPERTTFYGAREVIVKDPAGNIVTFASHEK